MILQKDFMLFRFNNKKPDIFCKEKYHYQLFYRDHVIANKFSDGEYFKGKVIASGCKFHLELIASASELNNLEGDNVFVIDVEIIK